MFNFLRNCQTFSQQLHHFMFLPAMSEGSNFSTFWLALVIFLSLKKNYYSHSSGYLIMILICISLVNNDVEHCVVYLLAILCLFFGEISIQVLCLILNWAVFLLLSSNSSLCMYSEY